MIIVNDDGKVDFTQFNIERELKHASALSEATKIIYNLCTTKEEFNAYMKRIQSAYDNPSETAKIKIKKNLSNNL